VGIKKIQETMINDKIKMIIENLTLSTKNGELDWLDKGSPDKRNYHREYYAIAEDGTRYETEVKYTLGNSGVWQLESAPSIWLRNEKLPNGAYYIYGGNADVRDIIAEFRKVIMDKYCKDMKPSEKIVEDALENIAKGISLSTYRDNKLNKILGIFGLSGK
jgi:hypothetical protein